ncbi:hypothetical protein SPRG_15283 [Saprolegnia parasitica CBS 223.65]|uniref:Uncharacterized protein n=1 Tax=Saprolegnia parasitica (strain CBS 223.65) TaxID=695850 RepID=A0A067BRV8_SAPPC|nr:hypothetical protein SPRG_15283 [Saprolegnia parasitica CBS 223.65]KDO19540.1 hypothetical protein SPRG_15283 [Saprolegnia parasitica CBS 223.65]|eukprot:XP_012209767.1 hypothetical protein SPRG_15283 [Saprolegnia parasitica CBS 223.65]
MAPLFAHSAPRAPRRFKASSPRRPSRRWDVAPRARSPCLYEVPSPLGPPPPPPVVRRVNNGTSDEPEKLTKSRLLGLLNEAVVQVRPRRQWSMD